MKKVWPGMAALAIMAASCSSSKSTEIVTPEIPKTPEWRLAGTIGTVLDEAGVVSPIADSIVITYNADKTFHSRESFQGAAFDFYFLYTAGYHQKDMVSLTRKFGLTGTPKVITEAYNDNHQLVRYFEPGYPDTRYDSLVYENNKIAKILFKHENILYHRIWEYTWQGDNLVEAKFYMTNQNTLAMELTSITTFTYNDAPSVFRPLAGYHLLRDAVLPETELLSANMPSSRTITDAKGKVYRIDTHTYSMNDKNLPETDTTRSQYFHDMPAQTDTYIRHYKYIDLNK
nr:hypothetical protein [uncultured Chitinophaga sp.]